LCAILTRFILITIYTRTGIVWHNYKVDLLSVTGNRRAVTLLNAKETIIQFWKINEWRDAYYYPTILKKVGCWE